LRILVAHNRYQYSGGEDGVVRDEVALLRQHGHSVHLMEQDNDAIHGLSGRMMAAASVFYSSSSARRMRQAIPRFSSGIWCMSITGFPMLSPSVFMEADSWECPPCRPSHNSGCFGANALLYRNRRQSAPIAWGNRCRSMASFMAAIAAAGPQLLVVTAAYGLSSFPPSWDSVDLFIASL